MIRTVRAVLLTGAGRGFSAGQDLGDRDPRKGGGAPDLGATLETFYNPTLRLIRALEKPVVCAVNGVAAGAGANIAFACDIVLAARSAKFIQAFSKIGLVPDAGGSWSLARILGEPRAKALALLAEPLDAETAADWGLIWKAVDDAALLDEARRSPPASPPARRSGSASPSGLSRRLRPTASTHSSTSSATCSARPGGPPTTPRASSPSSKSASRSSRADDHRYRPFTAGARRGLRRGDVVDDSTSQRLGMTIEHIAPGEATLSMEITEVMLNGHGLAHGGFIFALADSAFAFACNGYNQRTVGHQAAITYMAPGRLGDRLTASRARFTGRAGRHLRRACDERPGRAGGGVPRPFAHREGNPPAGVTGASNDHREEGIMTTGYPPARASTPSRTPRATRSPGCNSSG